MEILSSKTTVEHIQQAADRVAARFYEAHGFDSSYPYHAAQACIGILDPNEWDVKSIWRGDTLQVWLENNWSGEIIDPAQMLYECAGKRRRGGEIGHNATENDVANDLGSLCKERRTVPNEDLVAVLTENNETFVGSTERAGECGHRGFIGHVVDAVDVVNVGIHDTEVQGIALRVGASVRFTWTGSSWTLPVGSFLFTGTDGISSGKSGVVPAPAIGDIGRYLRGDGTWADVPLGGVPKYTVTPTAGQTIFTLPTAPTDASSVIMWVNGLGYRNDGTSFSVSDATVTWANLFVLGTTDDVFFTYI